ncbi:hypothetical protein OHD62_24220 [Mesorhizobium sp. YC-39]|uniref:hypothetical protein n=1 Tax=unclassified Mesorhizobium TaxID=325217 RepID=UPI0021E79537|nr:MULTISPECIES: hypothetical protein [unclassified Mesorhizobium]MCV3209157.1 hypothetical protein [Mesorhizobium sp. YC-2]MCV3231493.1 hypothetical protein [Mesorhizobium sp. YC-39]
MRLPWFAKSGEADRKRPSAASYRTEIIADVIVPDRAEPVRFFSRKLVSPAKLRRFSNRDFRESLLFGFYLGVAAILPVAWWAPICRSVSGFRLKRHMRKDFSRYAAATQAVLGKGIDARKLFRAMLAANHRRRLLLAVHVVRTRWAPTIRLEGLEGLQAALKRGKGAIIWCDQFTAQTIIGKRALHEAGVETHQVSVNFHGISDTTFGLRFLNPPLVAVENRFLKSRVVFERSDAYQVTIRMQKILKDNGVVLMTNNIHAGSTFAEAGMGESGWTHLASAPANFAARGGTALFAMSTLETVPFREYRAVISPELRPVSAQSTPLAPATRDLGPKNMELQAHYILLKRDRLLEALKDHPEQMMVWAGHQRFTDRSGVASTDDDTGS